MIHLLCSLGGQDDIVLLGCSNRLFIQTDTVLE
jgi:hypothetical protein